MMTKLETIDQIYKKGIKINKKIQRCTEIKENLNLKKEL